MFRDKIYAPRCEGFGILAVANGCGTRADFVIFWFCCKFERRKNGGKFDAKLSLRECRKLWLKFDS